MSEPPVLPSPDDATTPVIEEIMALSAALALRFEAEDAEEWQWMADHCQSQEIIEILQDTSVTMLHVLDAIGRFEPVNGITISRTFHIPKGSVSKSTRRLIARGLVQTEKLPNNRKEILFRVTPLGRQLFETHSALHQQMERGLFQFFRRYDTENLRFVVRLLQDLLNTPRINLDFRPDLLDDRRDTSSSDA